MRFACLAWPFTPLPRDARQKRHTFMALFVVLGVTMQGGCTECEKYDRDPPRLPEFSLVPPEGDAGASVAVRATFVEDAFPPNVASSSISVALLQPSGMAVFKRRGEAADGGQVATDGGIDDRLTLQIDDPRTASFNLDLASVAPGAYRLRIQHLNQFCGGPASSSQFSVK